MARAGRGVALQIAGLSSSPEIAIRNRCMATPAPRAFQPADARMETIWR